MSVLSDRKKADDALKGRFISKVLQDTADNINKAQSYAFAERGFNMSNGWDSRKFTVNGIVATLRIW